MVGCDSMDASRIFRKVALERMSSPEQIDELLVVTTPKSWLALSALIILLILAVVWGFWGQLATRVSGDGVLIRSGEARNVVEPGQSNLHRTQEAAKLEAVVYVPSDKAVEVQPGMEAEISPAPARREEYGFIRGKVVSVSDYPATEASFMSVLENASLVRSLSSRGLVTEVRVELESDPSTRSGYRWSSPLGAPIRLSAGTMCVGNIVINKQKPITLVFPYVKKAIGTR